MEIKDNIRTIFHDLCELRTCIASDPDYSNSLIVDLTGSEDPEINRLKKSLNYSTSELSDQLKTEIDFILDGKTSFLIPPSLDELVGKIRAHNNISSNPNAIGEIVDRIFRLPIDKKSKTYKNTSEINPGLSTLVKSLLVEPLIEASEEYEHEQANNIDTSQWGQDYDPEQTTEATQNEEELEDNQANEYLEAITAMPEVSIPYLFNRLKTTGSRDKEIQINSMHLLANMNLDHDTKQEQILTTIVQQQGSKLLKPGKKKDEKLTYALGALTKFEHILYNPELEKLLTKVLSKEKLEFETRFYALKVLSKMQYGNNLLESSTKQKLLELIADDKDYSALTVYAIITLANNSKSISQCDLEYLLELIGKTDAHKLINALLIKIGLNDEDFRSKILKATWSNLSKIDPETKEFRRELFSHLEIIKELSRDRDKVDEFIKRKPLDQYTNDEILVLTLVLGLYEGLTSKYKLAQDPSIDELAENLIAGESLLDHELVTEWHHLANNYIGLIDELGKKDTDDSLQDAITSKLTTYMHKDLVIDKLKELAINYENYDPKQEYEFKKSIISLLALATIDLKECLATEVDDIDTEPNDGLYTATRLIQGSPNKVTKSKAIDAILEIALQAKSSSINNHINKLVTFLGSQIYEEVIKISNETNSRNKAQLAELIMLNSRYLRSISYPAAA